MKSRPLSATPHRRTGSTRGRDLRQIQQGPLRLVSSGKSRKTLMQFPQNSSNSNEWKQKSKLNTTGSSLLKPNSSKADLHHMYERVKPGPELAAGATPVRQVKIHCRSLRSRLLSNQCGQRPDIKSERSQGRFSQNSLHIELCHLISSCCQRVVGKGYTSVQIFCFEFSP